MRDLLFFFFAASVAACGSAGDGSASDADEALTTAPTHFVLVRANTTKNAGDAFVAPANGGTLVCPSGSTASSCLVALDFSQAAGPDGVALDATEEAAAKTAFLAGGVVLEGAPLARGNKTLAVKHAWAAIGTRIAASAGEKSWLVTPGTAFHHRELDSTYARNASALAFDARIGLTATQESSARAAISTGGILVRGVHVSGVMRATAAWTPIAHASSPSGLTAAQAATVLHTVDDTCGDTWCDGDYNFSFDAITCEFAAGTCSMNLSVIYPNDGSPDAKTVPHTCGFSALHAYGDMIVTLSPVFSQLTEAFKTDMDGCIAEAEAAFPH